jgi:hypothetical protein
MFEPTSERKYETTLIICLTLFVKANQHNVLYPPLLVCTAKNRIFKHISCVLRYISENLRTFI